MSAAAPTHAAPTAMAPREQPDSSGSISSQASDLERAKNPLQQAKEKNQDHAIPEFEETPTYTKGEVNSAIIHNPFDDESGDGTKYKTLNWWHAGILLIAETISLGILSLPQVMALVGFLPGCLLIAGIGIIASYTGYIISQLKLMYPGLHSFADVGLLLFGRVGKEVLEIAQMVILVFVMAAHVLTFSVMMNVLTDHGTCTIVFTIVGMVVSIILSMPRTLKNMAFLSIFSCLSITAAIIITMIGIGVNHPKHPETYSVTPSNLTSFQQGIVAVSNIVVAFCGHIAFFGFISELREPREFPKSLAMLQTAAVCLYITVAVVIYNYAGNAVKSPAIGSASPIVAKVAYGIAIPTIVIAGVVNAHVAIKNLYVRMWRKTPRVMGEKSFRSYGTWYGLCIILWVVAWVIANAIPVFSQLIGLLGALFCSWFTIGLPAIFWLFINKGQWLKNWKKMALTTVNIGLLGFTIAICGLGVYGSGWEISQNSGASAPFSCADNS